MNTTARSLLEALYLDYFNNYLSVEKYAEHNGLTTEQAEAVLRLARSVHESQHPEA